MAQCVEQLPHVCSAEHTSSDGLQVWLNDDDTYSGYCFPCGTPVAHPYENQPPDYKPQRITKSDEEIIQELFDIYNLPTIDVPQRALNAEALDYYGVKVSLSESDGESPELLHFPYANDGETVAYKNKLLPVKKSWWTGRAKGVEPFGWLQALGTGAKKLIITEGEADAVALWQMITKVQKGGAYEDFIPAVISLPHGASSAVSALMPIAQLAELKFDEIILAYDMDDAGQKASDKTIKEVFPNAKVAHLPANDANACLLEGRSRQCVKAVLWNSIIPKNTRIIRGHSLAELACKKPEFGMSYPWQGFTDITRGIRRGETIYIGAGVKMGKSELVNSLAEHIITEHDKPVFLCKPEESMAKSYNLLVGKAAGRIFHDPNVEFDQEAWDSAEPTIGDKALILDSYQFVDWDTLRGDIKYSVVSEGVKDVIIDPITALTNTMGASESNEFLVNMSAELSSMAKDLDFTAFIFCHLKAPLAGEPHERGGKVLSNQFAGSRAMMRSCNYMIGLEGNKDPELDITERNMRKLVVLEDREFGSSGSVDLYWDYKTGLFNEVRR